MNLDARRYLDVNRFTRRTAWGHGLIRTHALYGSAAIAGVLFVVSGLIALAVIASDGGLWWRRPLRS